MLLNKTRTISVYPNPWSLHPAAVGNASSHDLAFDRQGRPCGVVPLVGGGGFVGATLDEELSMQVEHEGPEIAAQRNVGLEIMGLPRPLKHIRVFKFLGVPSDSENLGAELAKQEPITIDVTGTERLHYYVNRLIEGDLIAADKSTAHLAGLRDAKGALLFEDPKVLLPKIEAAATKAWDSNYSDAPGGASKQLKAQRKIAAVKVEPKKPAKGSQPDGSAS